MREPYCIRISPLDFWALLELAEQQGKGYDEVLRDLIRQAFVNQFGPDAIRQNPAQEAANDNN